MMKRNKTIVLLLIYIMMKFGLLYCNCNDNIIKEIKYLISNITNDDDQCIKNFTDYYYKSRDSEIYIKDLILYSSKSMNEIGSFINCINQNDKNNKSKIHNNFYIFISNNKNNNINNSFIFGLCLLNICNASEYKNLILKFNDKLDDFFQIKNDRNNFDVFDFEEEHEKLKITNNFNKFILNSIPFIIILFQIILILFPKIAGFLFNCLVKNSFEDKVIYYPLINDNISLKLISNDDSENLNSDSSHIIDKNQLFQITSCFSFIQNSENIMNLQNDDTTLYNDIGLNYIKGIRGLSIICFIIGNIFTILFQTPLIIKEYSYFHYLDEHYFIGLIIIFCVRHSPKIFLSCSGLCLSYKILCYFDDLLAYEIRNSDNEISTDEERNYSISNINAENRIKQLQKTKIFERNVLINKDPSKIKFIYFHNFLLIHLYKPFLLILIFFFFKYSFQYFIYYFTNCGPLLLDLIKNILEYIKDYEFVSHFFLFRDLIDLFYENQNNDSIQINFMNIFWLPINEINFTILGSILIFIGSKKKISIDYFIFYLFLLILIIKFIYLFISFFYNQNNPKIFLKSCLFGCFLYNQIFNLNFYLIGLFFGLVNYKIQKEISYKDILCQKKRLLVLPLKFKLHCLSLKTINNYQFYILIIFLDIFFALFFGFLIDSKNNFSTIVMKIISIFDIEFFLIIFHLILFLSYLKGDNKIYRFLSSNKWIIFNKLYFVFSCVCIPIILFIIYQSETKIKLNVFSIIFYSLICGFIIFVFSILIYIVFDLPYRRIIKFYLQNTKEKDKIKKKKY